MKNLILAGLLAFSMFGVAQVNAQSYRKEEYKVILTSKFSDLEHQLNENAKLGWKVRVVLTGNQFVLYREVQ
jgi:hypothetical protein